MDLRRYPLDEQNCTLEIESCEYKVLMIGGLAVSTGASWEEDWISTGKWKLLPCDLFILLSVAFCVDIIVKYRKKVVYQVSP